MFQRGTFSNINKMTSGTRGKAQQLRALAEDSGSVPSTHLAASRSVSAVLGDSVLSLASSDKWGTDTHAAKHHIHKTKMKLKKKNVTSV